MNNIRLIINNDAKKIEKQKFFIKDRNGNIIKKSENLNSLINKTSWNKLRLIQ